MEKRILGCLYHAGNSGKMPTLGIPTMGDRAKQADPLLALEPQSTNSYGFRPGRSCHDAIEAIYNSIVRKEKYVGQICQWALLVHFLAHEETDGRPG